MVAVRKHLCDLCVSVAKLRQTPDTGADVDEQFGIAQDLQFVDEPKAG